MLNNGNKTEKYTNGLIDHSHTVRFVIV